jgi:hypothetical protein
MYSPESCISFINHTPCKATKKPLFANCDYVTPIPKQLSEEKNFVPHIKEAEWYQEPEKQPFRCGFSPMQFSISITQPHTPFLAYRHNHLSIVQKRSSLLIAWNDILLSAEAKLLAEDSWHSDEQSSDEESGHDCESEDPLEGNGLE